MQGGRVRAAADVRAQGGPDREQLGAAQLHREVPAVSPAKNIVWSIEIFLQDSPGQEDLGRVREPRVELQAGGDEDGPLPGGGEARVRGRGRV